MLSTKEFTGYPQGRLIPPDCVVSGFCSAAPDFVMWDSTRIPLFHKRTIMGTEV